MTGTPPDSGAAGAPHPVFAVPMGPESRETVPSDCAFFDAGFLVQFRFASIVLGADGEVRDVFGSCGLRAVGSDDNHVSMVCGGGGTADSGHFDPRAFVRNVVDHSWLEGALPESLPRFVAGTIGDVKWSVVVDLVRGLGYRMAPRFTGDQCGHTFNSAWPRSTADEPRSTGTSARLRPA